MCGSKWDPTNGLTGDKNAFKKLGTKSKARYGCCPVGKYMSSPFLTGYFKPDNSCSDCPIGQYGSDSENDDTSCTSCPPGKTSNLKSVALSDCTDIPTACPPTQVPNSNKAETGVITGDGVEGTRVTVTCNTGWSGTGTTVCGDDLQWSPVCTCTRKNCTATQVANSDKAETGSVSGMF